AAWVYSVAKGREVEDHHEVSRPVVGPWADRRPTGRARKCLLAGDVWQVRQALQGWFREALALSAAPVWAAAALVWAPLARPDDQATEVPAAPAAAPLVLVLAVR